MANYNDLKTGIDAVIKTNGRQEISGAALNAQLKNMIAELGAGYQYMGLATPATNPGTPDANVFYLASEAGTYTNFGGIVINEGEVCALVWNGTWTKQMTGAATADKLNQLGQEVDDIYRIQKYDKNIYPELVGTAGFVYIDGSISPGGTTYFYTQKLSVNPGDVVSCNFALRFVAAYSGNTVLSDKGAQNVFSYTVPDGVNAIIPTITRDVAEVSKARLNIVGINNRPITIIDPVQCTWTVKIKYLAGATDLPVVANCHNKKGARYTAFFNITDAFTTGQYVTFGKGRTEYGSSYVKVDATKVYVYNNGSETLSYSHELTIKDYLYIEILVGQHANQRAIIRVCTNGGQNYRDDRGAGLEFVNSVGTVSFYCIKDAYNLVCSYCVTDLFKDVIVFGDSYVSLQDTSRWTDMLLRRSLSGFAISGFSGGTSSDEITSFLTIGKMRMPGTVIWAMGMNDPDNEDSVNTSWKECVEEVMQYCKDNGNELILCTIPNCPSIRHTFKNEYVRNSGYKVIDFARAVNADIYPSSWYDGMLSVDNVHPTQEGAMCLASEVMAVVPKLGLCEVYPQV